MKRKRGRPAISGGVDAGVASLDRLPPELQADPTSAYIADRLPEGVDVIRSIVYRCCGWDAVRLIERAPNRQEASLETCARLNRIKDRLIEAGYDLPAVLEEIRRSAV